MSVVNIIGAQSPYLAKKYIGPGSPRSYTDIPTTGAEVLRLADFTICAQGIAFAADRGPSAHRHISTCKGDAFNKTFFFRLSNTGGTMVSFFRTPAGEVAMNGSTAYDDGVWHNFAFVRDSSVPTFRIYVDGTQVLSDTTDPGTTTGDMDSAWGNWNPDSTAPDEPFIGGRLGFGAVIDSAMTTTEVDDFLNSAGAVLPGGMTILDELMYPDTGDSSRVEPEIGP